MPYKNRISVAALSAALSLSAAAWSSAASACGGGDDFIGSICIVGFNFAPNGWALTNGQLLSLAQNTALFSLLGTMYGGNGQTTFALPDTRGRVIIGAGQGPGLSNYGQSATGNADGPGGNTWAAKPRGGQYSSAAPNVAMNAGAVQATVGNTGGNQPVSIMQPYVVLNPVIALYGIYPPRN
jgi:microcystin-dependent protein